MYRIIISLILIIAFEIICYYFLQDFSICATLFLTMLLFSSWLFNFPEGKWLKKEQLHLKLEETGNRSTNNISTYNKNIKNIIHENVDLKNYSHIDLRIVDTNELIEDTQEAIIKTLIPYLLILMGAIFTHFSGDKASINMKDYKNYVTLIYFGVAFCYISWNVSPVLTQKKKNTILSTSVT